MGPTYIVVVYKYLALPFHYKKNIGLSTSIFAFRHLHRTVHCSNWSRWQVMRKRRAQVDPRRGEGTRREVALLLTWPHDCRTAVVAVTVYSQVRSPVDTVHSPNWPARSRRRLIMYSNKAVAGPLYLVCNIKRSSLSANKSLSVLFLFQGYNITYVKFYIFVFSTLSQKADWKSHVSNLVNILIRFYEHSSPTRHQVVLQ